MKRSILDQIASTLFNLEIMNRMESSSVSDSKGRVGEPMEWSEKDSLPNQFSEFVIAANDLAYRFKQWVADMVAEEYNHDQVMAMVEEFVNDDHVPVFCFVS